MNITIILIVGLIIVTVILALATAAIAASYSQLYDQFETIRKKFVSRSKDIKIEESVLEEERLLLKEKLEKVVVGQATDFQKLLDEFKRESLKLLSDVNESAKIEAKSSLQEFAGLLSSRANEDAQKTKAELDKYLSQKEKEIDDKALAVLQDVARKVLPEAIDLESKKDLIIAALKKAKEDHMFGI